MVAHMPTPHPPPPPHPTPRAVIVVYLLLVLVCLWPTTRIATPTPRGGDIPGFPHFGSLLPVLDLNNVIHSLYVTCDALPHYTYDIR